MIKITSHSLAQKLLALPNLPVRIDGIGEEVGIACEPNLGKLTFRRECLFPGEIAIDVVVLEIVTKRQEDKDRENRQLAEGL